MAAVSATLPAVLLATGGARDPLGLVAALATAASLTVVSVTGGATLVAGNLAFVMDGSTVLLPASPSSGNVVIVVNAVPAANCQVSPNGGTIAGSSGSVLVGGGATVFTYNGTTWIP